MKAIHEKVTIKKTRYDMFISVESASKLEQLCEAHELGKSNMAELIINEFYKKSNKIPSYLEKIKKLRNSYKKG